MGRRGPLAKGQPVERPAVRLERFEPPPGMSPLALAAWAGFWLDPASGFATPGDQAILIRWVTLVSRFERLMIVADREPLVTGSTGQIRNHPAYDLALRHAAEIRALEAVLNLGTANRSRLGVVAPTKSQTLDDVNADFEDGTDDGTDEDDPRLRLVPPGAA